MDERLNLRPWTDDLEVRANELKVRTDHLGVQTDTLEVQTDDGLGGPNRTWRFERLRGLNEWTCKIKQIDAGGPTSASSPWRDGQ